MILAGLRYGQNRMYFYHNGPNYLDHANADEVGNMLMDENIKSVSHRYPDDSLVSLPGPVSPEWLEVFKYHPLLKVPSPVETLKVVNCYEYQSCEHPTWHDSKAEAFCDNLKSYAIDALDGYNDAPGS